MAAMKQSDSVLTGSTLRQSVIGTGREQSFRKAEGR